MRWAWTWPKLADQSLPSINRHGSRPGANLTFVSGDNDQTAPVVGRAAAADPLTSPVTYVGRASLPPAPTRVWTDEDYYAYAPPAVLVEPPPKRSFLRLAWMTVGIVALFCLIGGATVLVTKAVLDRPPAAAAGPVPPS